MARIWLSAAASSGARRGPKRCGPVLVGGYLALMERPEECRLTNQRVPAALVISHTAELLRGQDRFAAPAIGQAGHGPGQRGQLLR